MCQTMWVKPDDGGVEATQVGVYDESEGDSARCGAGAWLNDNSREPVVFVSQQRIARIAMTTMDFGTR